MSCVLHETPTSLRHLLTSYWATVKPEKVEIVLAERPEPTLSVHRVYFISGYFITGRAHTRCSSPTLCSSVPSPSPVHSPAWHRLQLTAPPSPTAESGATPLPQFKNKVARFTSTYGLCPTFPSFTAAPQVVGECLHLPCKLWTTVATYWQPKQLKGVFSVALYISLGPILCKTVSNLQQPLANQ